MFIALYNFTLLQNNAILYLLSMTLFKQLRAIFALPFNVLIVIPCLLYFFLKNELIIQTLPFAGNLLRYSFAMLFLLFGLFLAITTILTFHKIGKGTLAPWDPPQKLVVVGMYRYVRNPMLTGIMFLLTSETLFVFTVSQLCWTLIFILAAVIIMPLYEEKKLIERFGDEYIRYKSQVPRWIPSRKAYKS